jgi:hypothetical protein
MRHDDAAVGDLERELDVLLDQEQPRPGLRGVRTDDGEHALDDHSCG